MAEESEPPSSYGRPATVTTATCEGREPATTRTDTPTALPPGSRSVTRRDPGATGTGTPQRVDPSAASDPKRTRVPGPAAWLRTRVAESGTSDSPKNHEALWPVRSAGRGPG